MKRAIVLLSGGLDSTTTLALVKKQRYEIYALTVAYGQKHSIEINAARRVAQWYGVTRHVIINLDLGLLGGSALTDDIKVPKDALGRGIPVTYVPARNTILLGLAIGWAEVIEARDIYLGVNALDYSGYPDCRPEFIRQFQRLSNVGTKQGVENKEYFRIHAPLIDKTKAEIIQLGTAHGVDYSLTHSCYDPDVTGKPCGRCDSCLLRARGFAEAGVRDPLL